MNSLKNSIESTDFQNALRIERYIDGAYLLFINQFSDEISKNNSKKFEVLVICFCLSVTLNLFCFIILWRFYAKIFNTRFIATLQMLKLIPSRVFDKNQNLDKEYANITKRMI